MSTQPKPTVEWTVEHGNMIYADGVFITLIKDDGDRGRVVQMHNDALAAELELHDIASWECIELRKQLAAEREISSSLGKLNATVHQHLTQCGEQLSAEREKVQTLVDALKFFASVIKSGESWSATCQKAYDAALAKVGKETMSNPTTGEWTVTEIGRVMLDGNHMVTAFNYEEGKALLDAINAALAENQQALNGALRVIATSQQLLAAEREKLQREQESFRDFAANCGNEIQQLRKQLACMELELQRSNAKVAEKATQLAAEREKVDDFIRSNGALTTEVLQLREQLTNLAALLHACETQLAAEREKYQRSQEKVKEYFDLLAAEREKVQALTEQMQKDFKRQISDQT